MAKPEWRHPSITPRAAMWWCIWTKREARRWRSGRSTSGKRNDTYDTYDTYSITRRNWEHWDVSTLIETKITHEARPRRMQLSSQRNEVNQARYLQSPSNAQQTCCKCTRVASQKENRTPPPPDAALKDRVSTTLDLEATPLRLDGGPNSAGPTFHARPMAASASAAIEGSAAPGRVKGGTQI